MADLRESFPTLQDATTGEGIALAARTEGQAAASQQGAIGFSFKDSSGNVVLPQLTANGKIMVDTEAVSGTPVNASAKVTPASVGTLTTIASLTLTASNFYREIEAEGSCFRDSEIIIEQVDDATTTVLARGIVGPGQFNVPLKVKQIQAGATGTQTLRVRGTNLDKVSDLRGNIRAVGSAT